ncbi:hypothetical protein LguiB_019935 [Lonicera macranthoides]
MWDNGHKDLHNVKIKLDRALALTEWRILFLNIEVIRESFRGVNHYPILFFFNAPRALRKK